MSEIWRVVADFQDYKISSHGRLKRFVPDRHGRIITGIIKPFLGNHGYHVSSLHKNGKQSVMLIHRLVCRAFHGESPKDKPYAAHKDGVRTNNKASNLRWVSASENSMDKHAHGTMRVGKNHHANYMPECMPRGSSHGNSKLTESAVSSILKDKRKQSSIAKSHNVSQSLIAMIKRRVIWKHVN